MDKKRIIVGISGASGMPLALELLRQLQGRREQIETHLLYTDGAVQTLRKETGQKPEQLEKMADYVHDNHNIGAAPASGSFRTDGMIVVPCSMKTVAGIVSGYSDNLLLRAADVTLKECRRLVLVTRECPLSSIHLRNMYELSRMGAVILPPVLSFYNHPDSLDCCVKHITGKILDLFGLEGEDYHRWEGMDEDFCM